MVFRHYIGRTLSGTTRQAAIGRWALYLPGGKRNLVIQATIFPTSPAGLTGP